MAAMWKIMAGRGSAFVSQFVEQSVVAVGWSEAGDHMKAASREALTRHFATVWPEQTAKQISVGANQVWRFMHEIQIGDDVLVYDPDERAYNVGVIDGPCRYAPELNERLPLRRAVKWLGKLSRDSLSGGTKNGLGAIMSIFQVKPAPAHEVRAVFGGGGVTLTEPLARVGDEVIEDGDPFENIAAIAFERVKDQILSLNWEDMQDLVAALLRALGYRTRVAPRGPDGGRDILASPDGFGFESPRIVAEVKHRQGAIGAPALRSFLQTLHRDDRGLYVSTGGFSKDATIHADTANNVVHLMTIDGLARALLDQYEALDDAGRRLLPLSKLYWPA